ncbi:ABC transporter permease [Clostridium sp. 'deep sea']|uniref:ABC transporter permease n=1 Tax=Clostridium sp. 'deep sea' TaxID=2779445 RepID=UPI001896A3DB|nr:ABC transporter permease [Clostridium sp. 'deep sea']QOR35480.1 ABC transporter permease [Clostridium sp. 'deep sea']
MRFSTITFKNIRFNIKRYKAIFLSISFGICLLFMFCSFYFNNELLLCVKSKVDLGTINMSFMVLIVFLVVFFSYAYKEFINSRRKEFALYISLGMTVKNIIKIIVVENIIIMLFAWLLGVVTGSVFANLYHLIITKLLAITNIAFSLNITSFLITLALLAGSFILVLLVSMFSIKKLSISELKTADQSINKLSKPQPLLAFISLLFIVVPIIILSLTVRNILKLKPYTAFIDVLLSLGGLFFFIAYGGDLVIRLISKNKAYFYKHLVALKEVNKRFFQLRKVLFVLSIGALAVIFLVGLSVGTAVTIDDVANNRYPYHISYNLDERDKAEFEQQLYSLATPSEIKLQQYKSCEAIKLYELANRKGKKLQLRNINIIKRSSANKYFNQNFQLQNNEVICIINIEETEDYYVIENLSITTKDKSITYVTLIKQVYIGNLSNIGRCTIVVTDDFYNKIIEETNADLVTYYTYNYYNLEETIKIQNNLMQKFEQIKTTSLKGKFQSKAAKNFGYPICKQQYIKNSRVASKFTIFIMFYIALIFFVISGVVLYLRVINSLEHSRKRFRTLNELGMNNEALKKIISKELILVFLLPVFLGGIMAIAFTFATYHSFLYMTKILLCLTISMIFYLLLQVMFFTQAKRKFINEVLKSTF